LPVQLLRGVGPRLAERLTSLGLYTLEDLLFHLPFRYQDRSRLLPLGALQPGTEAAVVGELVQAELIQRQRRFLLLRLADPDGGLNLRFFHFNQGQRAQLQPGVRLYCYGEVRQGHGGLEMIHPEYRCLEADESLPGAEHLVPVYPTTEGLGQFQLRALVEQALAHLELAGERALLESGATALIMRTAWVYGVRGSNFLLTMQRLFRERPELRVVDDQIGTPTWSRMLAEVTAQILYRGFRGDIDLDAVKGLYHVTSGGATSWFGFAEAIRDASCLECRVLPIPTSEYPAPAPRPAYSVLDTHLFSRTFGLVLPDWRQSLAMCLADLQR